MNFNGDFVPTAAEVGILPMLTYYTMTVATYCFLGSVVFSFLTNQSVAPEHRVSRAYGAIISVVAGVSYLLITRFYHGMLHDLGQLSSPEARTALIRHSYNAIGQYRYMDWAVTTPLLLLKAASMFRIKLSEATGAILLMMIADFLMVVTGYIGEQQLDASGEIIVGQKLLWGAISTVFYVVALVALFGLYKRFRERGSAVENWGFRFIGITAVTTWGVYPLGYMLTMTSIDLNYIHLTFSVFDVFNKVGISVVAYLVGKQMLDERLNEKKVLDGYTTA
ncbi:bacteriorhodopsin [Hymenobacter sp. RP-2-7]|uniref:Bacteriorhodopsin n=1 Tax=Hymenobacter polaris TaxID=2682546 RepID=A0A7Y0AF94_9BACT|nr:bacteriorhodopsin [Hymenobacter polaris]NML66289.1 bacteriorhodopsin [Hymenobacter polaris]